MKRLWPGLLACSLSCGGVGPRGSEARGAIQQGVVATVDGAPIDVAEVERLAERGTLTPRVALARLEAEALLAAEAERRGYGTQHEVQQVARQAAVQALLAGDVEQPKPTAADVERAYAANSERFHTPELRVASHVLVRLPKNAPTEQLEAARVVADDIVRRLRAAPDPVAALDAYRTPQHQPFEVIVEDLPPAPKVGKFVQAFSDAMFSLRAPGVVPEPVHTPFGWHAIVLREVQPETVITEAEARVQLLPELELNGERERLEALVQKLAGRATIHYSPDTRDALAALEL